MTIPQEVKNILQILKDNGYQAYIVGGCVRDLLTDNPPTGGPEDWDITTNAKPEQVQEMFPDSFYENDFGTVGIKIDKEDRSRIVEVTTHRIESKYSDKRHPDSVIFADTLEEDLKRRDFTINAIAMDDKGNITDLFDGRGDIKNKIVKAVGDPDERFSEDALRMMRAVRFATTLNFAIEKETFNAMKSNAKLLKLIAQERIRDELVKIVNSPSSSQGIEMLREAGLLEYIIPELLEGYGVGQNKHHIYTVWEHNLRALQYTSDQNYFFEVRMGSLLHDVGKPRTKRGDGLDSTFYAHEIVGGKMTRKIMERLRFSKDISDKVTHLVRYHLFYYNVGEVSEAGVRRFLSRVGPENVDDLIKVREADRIGSGVPKAVPYKLRHLLFMIEKVKHDPISPKMLKVNGEDVMKLTGMVPGPRIGFILNVLLEEVIDDPIKNEKKILESRVCELDQLSDEELKTLSMKAKETKEEFESGIEEKMKKKFYVK